VRSVVVLGNASAPHLVYWQMDAANNSRIAHAYRDVGGWHEEVLPPPAAGQPGIPASAAVGPDGVIHVASNAVQSTTRPVTYWSLDVSGWTSEMSDVEVGAQSLAIDPSGLAHIAGDDGMGGIFDLERAQGETTWSSHGVAIDSANHYPAIASALGPDSQVHIVWFDNPLLTIKHSQGSQDQWTSDDVDSPVGSITSAPEEIAVAVSGAGDVATTYNFATCPGLSLATRASTGPWSVEQLSTSTSAHAAVAYDQSAVLHMIYFAKNGSELHHVTRQ
jgi:hypothetical protein